MSTQVVSGNQYYNKVEDTVVTTSEIIRALRDVEPFSDITRYKTKLVIPAGTSVSGGSYWLYEADAETATSSVSTTPPTDSARIFRPNDTVLYANLKVSGSPVSTGTVLAGVGLNTIAPAITQTVLSIAINTASGLDGGTDAILGPTTGPVVLLNQQPIVTIPTITATATQDTIIAIDFVVISVL